MTLAIIESYSGGMTSPSATPVSTRMPGPDRQRQHLDRARRRRERPLRVLGVEAGLDRVALGRRRLALQAAAGGDVQLQLDEVEPGRQLGDRVLDLQAGVDLEEREALLGRLVEELDGAGVLRSRRRAARRTAAARRSRSCSGVSTDALRLLDHLLVAPLHAAVAHADRPHRAVVRRRSAAPRRGGRR